MRRLYSSLPSSPSLNFLVATYLFTFSSTSGSWNHTLVFSPWRLSQRLLFKISSHFFLGGSFLLFLLQQVSSNKVVQGHLIPSQCCATITSIWFPKFSSPQKKAYTPQQSPSRGCAITYISVFIILPFLNFSYKWNHTICELLYLSLSITFLRSYRIAYFLFYG